MFRQHSQRVFTSIHDRSKSIKASTRVTINSEHQASNLSLQYHSPQEIESFIAALLVKQTPSLFKSPPSTHYDIIVQNEASFQYDPEISGSRVRKQEEALAKA